MKVVKVNFIWEPYFWLSFFRWGTHLNMSLFPFVCQFIHCTPYLLIFWTIRVVKGQKKPKLRNKNYIRHAPYLRNIIAYDHDFWYTCVKWWFLIFWFVGGVESKKMAQNDKKSCLLHFISQEWYIIWLSFMMHWCEMMISVGVFYFFKILNANHRMEYKPKSNEKYMPFLHSISSSEGTFCKKI